MNVLVTPFTYRLVTSLMTPALQLWVRKRIRDGKEDPARLNERWGYSETVRPTGEVVWLHGASVGETQMLRPLIDRLLDGFPDRHVLVTSGTTTSAELLANQLPARAIHQYVPFDTPRATARFIAHWRPDLGVFAESELWPNLIWTARRADVPLALINARMSERSLDGWAKRGKLAASVLGSFDTILAADRRTADGLAALYMRDVPDVGSLKYDAGPLAFDTAEARTLKARIGQRPVWLAASTHEAEESAFHALRDALPDALMLWLPRHPSRGPAIADAAGAPRRSADELPDDGNVYIMDTLGEMGLALALADVCVMGGSLDPSLAGHNPLEAARAGVPVLTGPHVASFSDLYARMVDSTATMIASEQDLPSLIRDGLAGRLDGMAEDAARFATRQSGALSRTVDELESLLR